MKKIACLLLSSLLSGAQDVLCQNIPNGSSIFGTVSNIIPPHSPYVLGTGALVNYTVTFAPLYPVSDEATLNETLGPSGIRMKTTYFDGFSRNMETIIRNNVAAHDLIVPYDSRPGPNRYAYNPYSVYPSDEYSSIHLDPFSEQNAYYSGLYPAEAGTAITQTYYYSDAFTRSTTTYLPGKSNMGQLQGTTTTINTNAPDEIIIWKIDPSTTWPLNAGYYVAGTLQLKTTTNVDGAKVFEYSDNEGKLISKMVVINPMVTLTSYYVYDFYDRLVYTIHPKAYTAYVDNGNAFNSGIISNLCDYVVYDNFGRVVQSHLAGENGNNKYVYDQHNRVALTQKPNDESAVTWWWNHYDKLNRIIISGSLMDRTLEAGTMQSWFDNNLLPTGYDALNNMLYYLFHESQQGVYPNTMPISGATPYTFNYYNFYPSSFYDFSTGTSYFPPAGPYDPSIFTGHLLTGLTATTPPSIASVKTRGRLTCSASRLVAPPVPYTIPSYATFISNVNYYDNLGRPVESIKKNLHSDIDKFGIQYDFAGKPLIRISNYTNHDCTANPHTNIVTKYDYDTYTEKAVDVYQSINGSSGMREIVDYKYSGLGQLLTKNIGGPSVEQQTFTYNIRNQLTGINPTFATSGVDVTGNSFGEAIYYDAGFTHNLTCGGVTGIIWRSTGQFPQSYGYTYDAANRLVQADYREYYSVPSYYVSLGGGLGYWTMGIAPSWTNTHTDYTEGGITYDPNGNILTLNRYGPIDHGTYTSPGQIDNLTYTYGSAGQSNQIQNVADAVSLATTSSGLTPYDFKPGSTGSVNYYFDNNGNTTYDINKNVGTVYNYMDKPETRIFTTSTDRNDFVYDANGNKVLDLDNSTGGTHIIEYDGEVQYKDNALYLISHQEGYSMLNPSTSAFDFYYYVRDHLGNVRNVLQSYSAPYDVTPITPWDEGGGSPDGPVVYHATHETGSAPIEDLIFDNMDYVRDYKPDATDSSDIKGAHLDAADSTTTIGTTLVLKVMAGDSFSVSAQSFYSSADTSTGTIDSAQFIDAILATLVNGVGASGNADANELSYVTKMFSPSNIGVFNSLGLGPVDSTIPLTFINYIFYDENFNIIPEDCGQIQISPGPDAWQPMTSPGPVGVHHSGYVAVFMSTATAGIPVYIDPFVITYWKGSIVDINHYYPFGLCFNKSSSATTYPVEHSYLYQTTKQDKTNALYLDDFHARQYNPQLGRFEGVDAHNNFPSGYIGMGNNPVSGIDPSGNDWYQQDPGNADELPTWIDGSADKVQQDGLTYTNIGSTFGYGQGTIAGPMIGPGYFFGGDDGGHLQAVLPDASISSSDQGGSLATTLHKLPI